MLQAILFKPSVLSAFDKGQAHSIYSTFAIGVTLLYLFFED